MKGVVNSKFWLMILLSSLAATAYAVEEGFYLGAQAGRSNTHNTSRDVTTDSGAVVNVTPTNTGFGGRLFLGYSANPYVAMEGGWTYFAPSTYSVPGDSCDDPSIQESAFDVVGKGTWPIYDFGVFAKAGMAFTFQKSSGSLIAANTTCGSSSIEKSIRPVVGVGVSYDLTQNWVTDLSWTRIIGSGSFKNADLIALGISYHFVDKRCGQFLC